MGIKSLVVLSLLKYYDILIKPLLPLMPKQCSVNNVTLMAPATSNHERNELAQAIFYLRDLLKQMCPSPFHTRSC